MELPRRGKQKGQEGYGEGRAAIAAGDDVLLDEETLVAQLMACLEAPDYRPPTLPVVAVELMSLSQRPDVAIKDVVELLERDSLIAGRVLKVACSAVYTSAAKITSLRDATMRLGLNTIRDLVMEITLGLRVFKSADYADTMDLLRRHATATAHLCRIVSKYTAIEAEFSFMAGLLHDVGIAGTLLALSDKKGSRKAPPDLIAIWPAVDRVHARAGELMANLWGLPPDIRFARAPPPRAREANVGREAPQVRHEFARAGMHAIDRGPDCDEVGRRLAAALLVREREQRARYPDVVKQPRHERELGLDRRVLADDPAEVRGRRGVAPEQVHRVRVVGGLEDAQAKGDLHDQIANRVQPEPHRRVAQRRDLGCARVHRRAGHLEHAARDQAVALEQLDDILDRDVGALRQAHQLDRNHRQSRRAIVRRLEARHQLRDQRLFIEQDVVARGDRRTALAVALLALLLSPSRQLHAEASSPCAKASASTGGEEA